MANFPDSGQLFKASVKKHDALIFFIHFYKGHKKALNRHIKFMNELGFDAYAFNLKDNAKDHFGLPYSHVSKKFGMKHALADQIEQHLNLLSAYSEKIIFTFSNISACAMEAAARRQPFDITAMICDSGPSMNFMSSAYNLYTHSFPIKFLPFRLAATPVLAYGWSPDLHKDIPTDLKKFPTAFPLLSIRGWKDPLIKPRDIDLCFESCYNIVWQKLALPEAAHLNGLRDFSNEYKPAVTDFLNSVAQ